VIGAFILFKDERGLLRSGRFWFGLIFALGGFTGLSLLGREPPRGSTLIGLIIVFSCSLFWAGYQLSVRRNLSHIPATTAFGPVALMTSVPLLICMMTFGRPEQALKIEFTQQLLVIASGIWGICIGHVLFYVALKRLGVTICTVSNLIGAFLTALLSRFVFGESLNAFQWMAGCLLVFGGILLLSAQDRLGPVLSPSPAQARLNAE
jgi:drug/metabolite transporter (DMT)-like permease